MADNFTKALAGAETFAGDDVGGIKFFRVKIVGGKDGQGLDFLIPDTLKDLAAVNIGAIATVWTPAAGKKFRLMGGTFSVSAAGSVLFEDNTAGTTVFRTPKLLADTPYSFDLGNGKLSVTADNVLKATLSVAGTITGTIYGVEE